MEPVPLQRLNTFRLGGSARQYHRPRSVDELAELLRDPELAGAFVLGGGSNTIFPDGSFERPVISTEGLRRIERRGHFVEAECGVRLGTLIAKTGTWGLAGLEGFVGIPGTVGGAVIMNAGGAAGKSFGQLVHEIVLVDRESGNIVRIDGKSVPWRYRSWGLAGHVVAAVVLDLEVSDALEVKSRSREYFLHKRRTQPLESPSAGCIFKNPPGCAAGELIDRLGLKGLERGDAQVSKQHANFIVNRGHATSADVIGLIREVQDRVERAYGIRLETEVVIAEDV
jgi:UDP-N-acetylmuramate dehydrogenase